MNPQPRVARGKADDPPLPGRTKPKETRPATVLLPSPEELGIASMKVPVEAFDWSPVQRRFRDAGASCFHVEFMPEGSCKLICLLPAEQPDHNHRIDVQCSSEEEAARLALAKLDDWHVAKIK
ncbi:MAG: hypothetical protein ACJ8FY_14590 [Gemmataceae bacterium]